MRKLSTKITFFYAFSIISIVLISCLVLYFNIKNSLTEDMETYLKQEIVIEGLTLNSELNELEKDREKLIDKIKNLRVFNTGYYILMDKDFNLIYHPDENVKNLYTVADGSLGFLADDIKNSEEKFGSINYFYKNENKILSFYKLKNGWTLSSAPVKSEMYSDLNDLTRLVLLLVSGLIILGLLAAYILARSISNRMLSINKMANFISEGNLDIGKYSIKSKDEIGTLERAFFNIVNNMKSLNYEIDTITNSIYEGNLDKRADESKYKGFFKDIIFKVNLTINTFMEHMDKIPLPILIIDKNQNVRYINAKGIEFLKKSKKQVYKAKCSDLMKTDNCNNGSCPCKQSIENNNFQKGETIARPFDDDINISYTSSPISDIKGNVLGAIAIIIDQTVIKKSQLKIEKQLNYQKQEVEKILNNLTSIELGNFNINTKMSDYDEDTKEIGENISLINNKLNNISSELSKTISNINNIARHVSVGSEQLSKSSQMLAEGNVEQSNSIDKIRSNISEISVGTKTLTEDAKKANKLSNNTTISVEKVNEKMYNLVKSIYEIDDSSKNISNIIKVIDEIAFQTNILSLNASIEASRAGAHGKGFSVVANEVRNLAKKTSEATDNIEKLIGNSVKRVEVGTEIANKTAKALEDIIKDINVSNKIVDKFSNSYIEQSNNINSINDSLEKLSKVVENNSAISQEEAASSEELSSQSKILENSIKAFKLKKNNVKLVQSLEEREKQLF